MSDSRSLPGDEEDDEKVVITSRYADGEGVVIDAEKIPKPFRHIIPHAIEWAIGDDAERADYMTEVPRGRLQAFVDAVWPLIGEIDDWCAKHRDDVPVPDEVMLFDWMCEAAAEAVACHVEPEEENSSG